MKRVLMIATVLGVLLLGTTRLQAQKPTVAPKGLDIHFIDTEGGAATLIITPASESVLIDCGNPGVRDAERIAKTAKEAGLKAIDYLICTHWHLDHYGGAEELAKRIPIRNFYDRGIPETLPEDSNFPKLIAAYRAASKGKSVTMNPGDILPLKQHTASPLVQLRCLSAREEVITDAPNAKKNPHAEKHVPKPEDRSDNAKSLGFILTFGAFRFLNLGDLTWNIEYKLISPSDKIGLLDVYLSTHHGLNVSNNVALLHSVRPRVAIYNNGPTKGGHPDLTRTLRDLDTLLAIFQIHKNLNASEKDNASQEYIANNEPSDSCKGEGIALMVAPNSNSYQVKVGTRGLTYRFVTRTQWKAPVTPSQTPVNPAQRPKRSNGRAK